MRSSDRTDAGTAQSAGRRGARNLAFIRIWEHEVPEYERRGWRKAGQSDCTAYDLRGEGWRDVLMVTDGGPAFRSQHADQKYLDDLFTGDVWVKGWEWERED